MWKIGSRIFAIGSRWGKQDEELDVKISFKCSDFSYQLLIQEKGIIPAPYLARAKWVQIESGLTLNDDEVRDYIHAAYDIIISKLTRAVRQELGL